jgi:hypothetical protein
MRRRENPLFELSGQRDVAANAIGNAHDPEMTQHEPQLQGAEAASE